MRALGAVLLVVLAGACTPMQWQKADATEEQMLADERACQQHAWREAAVRSTQYQSAMGPVFIGDGTGRGTIAWPSSAMVDPYGYQLVDEHRFAQLCMEAKGYRLVPVPRP